MAGRDTCGEPAFWRESLVVGRRARGSIAAGTYHVTTRSAGPTPIFTDDVERTQFCNQLVHTMRRTLWTCRAFCVMSTHYHLLLDVSENKLQDGMQRLNWAYSRRFNARHGLSGHLFGERFHAVPVENDGHMLSLLRYLALNPVAAGLCTSPSDWIWGSYRGCIGVDDRFPFVDSTLLRSYFGTDAERATVLIRQFVEDE